MNFRRYSAIVAAVAVNMVTAAASASICVSENRMPGAVDLRGVTLCVDSADHTCVHKAAGMLAVDLEAVTGVRSGVVHGMSNRNGSVVVAGTIGYSGLIDGMIESGELDVADIAGGWERFVIRTVPAVGNDRPAMIVIAGSDRRGTAYGITTLSHAIGVDPWVWWADVPVERRTSLWVMADSVSQTPSVKYRGIFVNDEDWGLHPWAAGNYEKELGDIGPLTYARVCELLLRLRGNMLAPAMHDCTGAFYSHPESKQTVDDYGIIVTTSHCEPMLFNNFAPSEWSRERDGEWDYSTNRSTIFGKFDSRVAEASEYENIYT
ncbi:MAG: glycosyl hydrolase 115 family protein, partial [Duncaniella sp.]|nr:glycosyl hydrolase 115 family protein [Duncaniella sp.]